jgi:hypothetical protein
MGQAVDLQEKTSSVEKEELKRTFNSYANLYKKRKKVTQLYVL